MNGDFQPLSLLVSRTSFVEMRTCWSVQSMKGKPVHSGQKSGNICVDSIISRALMSLMMSWTLPHVAFLLWWFGLSEHPICDWREVSHIIYVDYGGAFSSECLFAATGRSFAAYGISILSTWKTLYQQQHRQTKRRRLSWHLLQPKQSGKNPSGSRTVQPPTRATTKWRTGTMKTTTKKKRTPRLM